MEVAVFAAFGTYSSGNAADSDTKQKGALIVSIPLVERPASPEGRKEFDNVLKWDTWS